MFFNARRHGGNQTLIEKIEYKNQTIEIHHDSDGESPREWDNIGKILYHHSNYKLGDEEVDTSKYESWDAIEEEIMETINPIIVLPLYVYEHSGITIRTKPFSCKWDSFQFGLIYATKESMTKCMPNYTDEDVVKQLKLEIEVLDQYLRGEVYGFCIKDKNGKDVESCWRYYNKEDMIEEAKGIIG